MGKTLKILITIAISISVFFTLLPQSVVNAKDGDVSSMVGETTPVTTDTSIGSDLATKAISKILGFLQFTSGLVSVIVIAFTGFNYIVVSEPDMKKEVKKKMLPIVIGMILIFSGTSIARFILSVVDTGFEIVSV